MSKSAYNDEDINKEDFDLLAGMDPQKMLIMLNPMLSGYFDVAEITNATGSFSTGKLSVDQLGLILKKGNMLRISYNGQLYTPCLSACLPPKRRKKMQTADWSSCRTRWKNWS